VLSDTPIAAAIAGCVIPLSRNSTIWMRWRCAAGIFHRSAVFSRRTSALLHLPICSLESDGTSESQLGTEKQLTQAVSHIYNHPRFTPLWKTSLYPRLEPPFHYLFPQRNRVYILFFQ
jgi:hypothetical protein